MFCDNTENVLGVKVGEAVVRQEWVEGVPVEELLDTGSARTLVRKELYSAGGKSAEGTNRRRLRCAHGELPNCGTGSGVGDQKITVKAGMSDRLPVQLFLGRDVSELFSLITR